MNELIMKVELIKGQNGRLPERAYPGDAGFDLFVSEDTEVDGSSFGLIPSGIKAQMPDGMWFMLFGRSSASNKRHLIVIPAVIDAGYRGALYANVYNPSPIPVSVGAGERIAQIVPFVLVNQNIVVSEGVLDDSPRGDNGFGSSGGLDTASSRGR